MRGLFIIGGILTLAILGLLLWIQIADKKQLNDSKPWVTYSRLMYCVSHGCNEYKKRYGSWPNSLDRLRAFGEDLNERSTDMWGHDFILVPYNESLGYGRILSYGADGKPGGELDNRDIEVRFPSELNETWNTTMGLQFKRPHKVP
jgi:hypothetical protein